MKQPATKQQHGHRRNKRSKDTQQYMRLAICHMAYGDAAKVIMIGQLIALQTDLKKQEKSQKEPNFSL